jgi:hypothetical protein
MFVYNAFPWLGEIHLSEFRIANVRLAESPERAVYINDGCSPSKKEYRHRTIANGDM